jgi:hypothetical protein
MKTFVLRLYCISFEALRQIKEEKKKKKKTNTGDDPSE